MVGSLSRSVGGDPVSSITRSVLIKHRATGEKGVSKNYST